MKLRFPTPPGWRWQRLGLLLGAIAAAPFVLMELARWLHSDVLGWVAGLSLMALMLLGPPLALVLTLVWALMRRRQRRQRPMQAPAADGARAAAPDRAPARPIAAARPSPILGSAQRAALPGLLLAMLGVGAGFWVFIALGFRWQGQAAPAPIAQGFWPAVLVLMALLALLLVRWLRSRRRPRDAAAAAPMPSPGGVRWTLPAADAGEPPPR